MRSKQELVEFIKTSARLQGTSLTKIEEALGWGNGTIGKWANAKKYPQNDKLQSVAEILNLSVEDIVLKNEKTNPAPQKTERDLMDDEMITLYQAAPDRIRSAVLEILKNDAEK